MSEAFQPPSIESQYDRIHRDNLPEDHVKNIKAAIDHEGIFMGRATPYEFTKNPGVIDVQDTGNPAYIRILRNSVLIPHDHPVRSQSTEDRYRTRSKSRPRLGQVSEAKLAAQRAKEEADVVVGEIGTTHEALADFLQVFSTEADNTHIGYGTSNDYKYSMSDGLGCHIRMTQNGQTMYALSRIDMQVQRRPHAKDEMYAITNMETGSEFSFRHSDIDRVRNGIYARTSEDDKATTLDPREIAQLAGIGEDPYANDPITILTRGGTIMTAELTTADQLERFNRLYSLGSSECQNAQTTFAPATTNELLAGITAYRNRLELLHAIKLPPQLESVAWVFNKDNKYELDHLIKSVQELSESTQKDIFNVFQSISTRELPRGWDSYYAVDKFVRSSITRHEDNTFTPNPSIALVERLDCDRYDFLESVFKMADGFYSESMSFNLETKETTHHTSFNLNEAVVRELADIFEWRLMETVDVVRDSYHIPSNIPPADQIILMLQNQGFTEMGHRIVQTNVATHRPDLTVPNWGEVCCVITRCREEPITPEDRTTIEKYQLPADAIARFWERAPGSSAETIAKQLITPQMLY